MLLELGPSTGYGVARAARLARANAYAALEGLSSRGAAQRSGDRPIRYRATDPDTFLVQLAAESGERLERLGHALQGLRQAAEPVSRSLEGTRAVTTVIQHLVARAERSVDGVLAGELWAPTLPAWRRAAGRASIRMRITGGGVDPEGLAQTGAPVDHPTLLLVDDRHTVLAVRESDGHVGLWSASPLLVLLARMALGAT